MYLPFAFSHDGMLPNKSIIDSTMQEMTQCTGLECFHFAKWLDQERDSDLEKEKTAP